ncbi:MAG: HAD family hydrolase [Nitrososphaerota archaeon]|jgi:putative hydrolase of the HAD superfamily|nr:HAD family hydrolase [Nitrososphaerota archaeon]MDG6923203.1 HAD family hydrolase [Nitrososphaerota archaeon]
MSLSNFKAVFLDLFDTLVTVEMDQTQAFEGLFSGLADQGFDLPHDKFKSKYLSCRENLRVRSLVSLKEYTNSIAITEAMKECGIQVELCDQILRHAVDFQFEPFVRNTRLMPGALDLLKFASKSSAIGIITNFTYAPVVSRVLHFLRIDSYLQDVTISHEVGYRKPHEKIFRTALASLRCEAKDSVMIGDSLTEDIVGAKHVGMHAFLFLKNNKLIETAAKNIVPDKVIDSLVDLMESTHSTQDRHKSIVASN